MIRRQDLATFRTIFAVLFACFGRQSVNDSYTSAGRFIDQLKNDLEAARVEDEKEDEEREARRIERLKERQS